MGHVRGYQGFVGLEWSFLLIPRIIFVYDMMLGMGLTTRYINIHSMDTSEHNTWQRINHLQVLGESNLVIEWVNHNHHIRNSDLKPIMNKIIEVKSHFHDISFTCEYREFNTKVDNLSKDVILLQEGTFIEQEFRGEILPSKVEISLY